MKTKNWKRLLPLSSQTIHQTSITKKKLIKDLVLYLPTALALHLLFDQHPPDKIYF